MADYLHGAYGEINAVGSRVSEESQSVIVYVGTAPVQNVVGGASNVNVPILVNNIAEARKYFGYSDDWASYTLCEAMKVHFETKGVGPVVFINVLDPDTHKSSTGGSSTITPVNGVITITSASKIVLDSVVVKVASATKVKDTDYSIAYNIDKETITITELTSGALGTEGAVITYTSVDPTKVDADAVIGASDGNGKNTGIYAIKDVYQLTGCIPAFLACPGFSSDSTVHAAMYANSVKVNGHWDVYMFADLPLVNGETALTFDTIAAYKKAQGYTHENETVYFPLAKGTDGNIYHLSVLAAANLQELLLAQDGIPYKSASNTACKLISCLYLGEDNTGRIFADDIINEKLNKHGIASAAYVGGRWAIWGAHCADYDTDNATTINVAETNRMMLYYLSNDFQDRRTLDVDRPMTSNDLAAIVSEEQARLDALLNIGALIYAVCELDASVDARSDVMNGDYKFIFSVTTTPLAKSLTAVVTWTEEGFSTYFEEA